MSNITQGSQNPVEGPQTYSYDPNRGYSLTRRWRSSDATKTGTLTAYLTAAGFSWQATPSADGAVTDIEATVGSDPSNPAPETTILTEIWERDVYTTEKDILDADIAAVGSITEEHKTAIRASIANPDSYVISVSLSADETKILKLMRAGVKSHRVHSPIVRRTRITANNYSIQNSDANVGKILTVAQMTSLENTPGNVLFALPTNSYSRSDLDCRYGFYKKPARVIQQGDGKWQIVQEYEWDYWSNLLYANAS